MPLPQEVDKAYVRRRAGAEWFFKDRPLHPQTLAESIEEDFGVRVPVKKARQLLAKYVSKTEQLNRTDLEQEFVGAMRELAIENPEFTRRLKSISAEDLRGSNLGKQSES